MPIAIAEIIESVPRLLKRLLEEQPAKDGLDTTYTIAGETETGREFLFGEGLGDRLEDALADIHQSLHADPTRVINNFYKEFLDRDASFDDSHDDARLTALALETPEQWAISWTSYQNVYGDAQPRLTEWAATMTDVDAAEKQFWPTFARYGVGYNLLILQKLTRSNRSRVRRQLGRAWTDEVQALLDAGRLYAIDMSLFEEDKPNRVDGLERFTPATITLLEQDAATQALTPILVRVAGNKGVGAQVYTRTTATASAWLYAMFAAKTSITVYGIWLGHVYQWHIVTAAMQMTMFNELPTSHPVYELLAPQSKYVFGFDDILLLLWKHIAPPTSISTPFQFLELINGFARDRPFAADNPRQAIVDLELDVADFTVDRPWDQYPIVGYFLDIWDAASTYVDAVVDVSYDSDLRVRQDRDLQAWLSESEQRYEGNVEGLPDVDTRAELADVLTSLMYRISIHGVSRMGATANPAMTFVPNFPPCLQNSTIPDPHVEFDTRTLLSYLPHTGTIGAMMTFYFTFAFTAPYEPFIPAGGADTDLFYPGGPRDPRNAALIEFRGRLAAFIDAYQPGDPQLQQWPLNIET